MGYHIPNDFQSHLVQSMIKLRPHTLHMYWLLVFGSRVLGPWDPGTLHSACTTIQGVDWCSACSVPTLVTLCVRTRIQFPLSCKNRNSSQWLVNQGKTCPEHYFWYFYFCDAVLKHLFGRLEPWLCLDYRTILGLKCFIWKSETIRLCRQDVRKSCRWACVQSYVLTLNTDTKNPVSISVYFCTPPLTIYV